MNYSDDEANQQQKQEDVDATPMRLPELLNDVLQLLVRFHQILIHIINFFVESIDLFACLVDSFSHFDSFYLPLLSFVDKFAYLFINFLTIFFPPVHGLHLELGGRFCILFPYPFCAFLFASRCIIQQPRPDISDCQIYLSFSWSSCRIRRLH